MKLTPLVLTMKTFDLRCIQSSKGVLLTCIKGGLRSELLTILEDAGLNPLMKDEGEILLTYTDLVTVDGFLDAFANWAIENNLYVDHACDH